MMLHRRVGARYGRGVVTALILAVSPWCARTNAQVIVTTDRTVGDTDGSLDGQDVIVRGATLTISGAHTLLSLRVERNASNQPGVVTHTTAFSNGTVNGLALSVAGNVS